MRKVPSGGPRMGTFDKDRAPRQQRRYSASFRRQLFQANAEVPCNLTQPAGATTSSSSGGPRAKVKEEYSQVSREAKRERQSSEELLGAPFMFIPWFQTSQIRERRESRDSKSNRCAGDLSEYCVVATEDKHYRRHQR